MNGASIRSDAWKTGRKAIEQEISAQESVPGYKVALKLRQLMFGDSIFARASGGTIPSFEKMTAGDIAAFYRTWYHPNNATLIVAGDIDTAKTLDRIRTAFDPIPNAALPVRAPLAVPAMAATALQDKVDLPVSFGALLYRSPGTRDPDYDESQVLCRVFNDDRPIAELTAPGKISEASISRARSRGRRLGVSRHSHGGRHAGANGNAPRRYRFELRNERRPAQSHRLGADALVERTSL